MKMINRSPSSQQGAVLAIALIILLVITLIGTATLQTTGLEENMAAATQYKNMSFQASETAIEEAFDDPLYLSSAYGASRQGASWPTKQVATSGNHITAESEVRFLEVVKAIVRKGGAESISEREGGLAFYNYEVHGTSTIANTGAVNTNVQGAYVRGAAE